jgi:hypothetical protein
MPTVILRFQNFTGLDIIGPYEILMARLQFRLYGECARFNQAEECDLYYTIRTDIMLNFNEI